MNGIRIEPSKSCGKNRYDSKKHATTAMNAALGSRRGHRRRARPERLSIYHCPRCNGWHLTHKEQDE